jgi:hypothetical protein
MEAKRLHPAKPRNFVHMSLVSMKKWHHYRVCRMEDKTHGTILRPVHELIRKEREKISY